ncbi:SAM-dependent methyltransferase [Leuconostoc falkenbergense]|uniref:SAM-dependent methyltransferase n=1 Tax=Leuconostoc falkenbergense TaxID=2766470 RepID=UPI0024A8662D|nr:SAM-dependent methyltransferase [Leuconostoc falkenbergense]MDI6552484.1 SAM-dependent methyltransferase [Leuconostoc falkenbergense]
MISSSNTFTHQIIEQNIKIGDLVLDGTTANGVNTRFLATRVGNEGHVLSYATTKDNANAAAASLFMSGLSERVTLLGHNLTQQLSTDMGERKQINIAIFDYSSDTENTTDKPPHFINQIDLVLPKLTHGGLLITKFNATPKDWLDYLSELIPEDFNQANYTTSATQTFIIERI